MNVAMNAQRKGMAAGTARLTWTQIVAIEPSLQDIIAEAKAIPDPWWDDYSELKMRLSALVGTGARNQRLRNCQAYDVAIDKLVEALRL